MLAIREYCVIIQSTNGLVAHLGSQVAGLHGEGISPKKTERDFGFIAAAARRLGRKRFMANRGELLLGEFARTIDERHRLSLPSEFAEDLLEGESKECLLAKERPGCLSLWNWTQWRKKLDDGVALVRSKMDAGKLDGRVADVQSLGRLLSTRHRQVSLAGRGRLVIPEGFREFLGVESGADVMLVGAAVCVEIWHPDAWAIAIGDQMPGFRELFDQLSS